MHFDNAVRYGQTQPGTPAYVFCREEGLEDAIVIFRRNAAAVVAYGQPDTIPFFRIRQRYFHASSLFAQRLDSVLHEVYQDLRHLVSIDVGIYCLGFRFNETELNLLFSERFRIE